MTTKLNEDALRYLRGSGIEPITEKTWARFWESGSTEWGGDECGCPDDRCIGHHHGADEPCGCLRVLVAEYEEAEKEAIELWNRHQAGDEGAIADGGNWVRQRHDYGLTGWSYDVVVDDEAGIAIRSDDNPQWRLLWSAGSADQW